MKTVISGAFVYTPAGFEKKDVLISDGIIESFAPSLSHFSDADVLHLHHCHLFPGLIDVHVHLREPGFSYKEDLRTGTLAAARGGFTTVCAMPNLEPAPDCMEHLEVQTRAIKKKAVVKVRPYGCITRGQGGAEPADLEALAPHVAAFSDDGRGVQGGAVMERAMRVCARLGKIVAAHCEDEALLRGGYIHDGEYAARHGHRGISSESEYRQIERDLELARRTGCAYHVCHVSAAESVARIRAAKRAGVDVTCETAPHYLLLMDSDLQEDGRFKMNPPLRAERDRAALREGIRDGTIDMIATDHAPHSAAEKARGLRGSRMGVVGLETAFPVLYTGLVRTGLLSLERLVTLLHTAPAARFGLSAGLVPGAPADLTVFDLERRYTIDPAEFLSKGRATPFAGTEVYGACVMTMVNGRIVWKAHSTEKSF